MWTRFGIVMFECWTREPPFQGQDSPSRFEIVRHILDGGRPRVPLGVDRPLASYDSLMKRCWETDPADRPLFVDVVSMLEVCAEQTASEETTKQQRTSDGKKSWRRFLSRQTPPPVRNSTTTTTDMDEPLLPLVE
mmetsp:Transcript_23271/g.50559  ORF Transcript_23271/g.50559 Transcript_23271/m.50559 type:complete len:135 (-) Transcript_23271:20-424(-)